MKKITLALTAMLLVLSQNIWSQSQHSRITISNPTPQVQYILAQQGVDLRCGATHHTNHNHSRITLDISDADRNVLDQLGISYTTEIPDLQTFYKNRAESNLATAVMEAQLEDARNAAIQNTTLLQKGSISSEVLDNYLQFDELDEKDWVKPQNFELGSMGGCYTISEVETELD